MSRSNEATDPDLALTLNPFNADAAVNVVVGALNGDGPRDLPALAKIANSLIAASRADARGYSLLGAVVEAAGNNDRAQALYALALEHSKSELHALLRTADTQLAGSNRAGALETIDLLLRRWPDYWEQVKPVLVALAADPETSTLVADRLNELPPWRSRAISALAGEPGLLDFLARLIDTAPDAARQTRTWQAERNRVIGALFSNKAYIEAQGLFLSTLTPDEATAARYVFDGDFALPINGQVFGWRVQKPGAVEVRSGALPDLNSTGVAVRFLDSPARPGILSQVLLLPFGTYRLAMEATARGLVAPRELFWTVRCGEGPVLLRLPVPDGTRNAADMSAEFIVPDTGCETQVLSLDTDVKTSSWRDRYQGEVEFSGIVITRL